MNKKYRYKRICILQIGKRKPRYILTLKECLYAIGVLDYSFSEKENDRIYMKHYHRFRNGGFKELTGGKDGGIEWKITREPITTIDWTKPILQPCANI